jgi:hypothetical protein
MILPPTRPTSTIGDGNILNGNHSGITPLRHRFHPQENAATLAARVPASLSEGCLWVLRAANGHDWVKK